MPELATDVKVNLWQVAFNVIPIIITLIGIMMYTDRRITILETKQTVVEKQLEELKYEVRRYRYRAESATRGVD